MLAAAERWGAGADGRPFLPRAFSVARRHAGGTLDFLLEAVGPGTERLAELGPGDGLWVLGPLGRGSGSRATAAARSSPAAGWGSHRSRSSRTRSATARSSLLGFRDGAHVPGAELLRGARLATDDGSAGHQGFVTDLLAAELGRDPHAEVFACGPPPMLEAVRALCARLACPAQLALESGMACGFGGCFGCVVPTRDGLVRLCLDGPVLDAATLDTCLAHA